MTIDPFATPETTNTTTDTDSQKENTPTVTTSSATNPTEISTTIKHGAGYDAPWTVVRTPDAATAIEIMDDPDFKKLMELTGKIAAQVQPEKPAAAPARSGGNGKPAGASAAPNGETPPEGYVFKTGVSKKTGKPWKAFMPIDRNSGLEVIWLRD